ncbi:hypothetical protein HDU67_004934, partial [Dinochytrium kinnereticum]
VSDTPLEAERAGEMWGIPFETEHAGEISGGDPNDGNERMSVESQRSPSYYVIDLRFNNDFRGQINSERRRRGLRPLEGSTTLARVAAAFVRDMVLSGRCGPPNWNKLKKYRLSQSSSYGIRQFSPNTALNAWKKENAVAVAGSRQTRIGCHKSSWANSMGQSCSVLICVLADNSSILPNPARF